MGGARYVCATCGSDLFAQWREGDGYRCRRCGGYTLTSALGLPAGWDARPPLDGTWSSPGYRSASTRAWIAIGLLALSVVLASAASVVALRYVPYTAIGAAGRTMPAGARDLALILAGLGGLQFLTTIATGLAFVAWLSRAIEIAPPLGLGTPPHSPREAIGWWFVPIANLFIPYQIVRDLDRRVRLGHPRTLLVLTWWVLFMVAVTADRFTGLVTPWMTASPDYAGRWAAMWSLAIATGAIELALAVAALLAIFVVDGVRRAENARATAVGAVDLPSQPVAWGVQSQPAPAQPTDSIPTVAPSSAAADAEPSDGARDFCPRCGRPRAADGAERLRFCRGCGFDFDAGAP